jgi:CheY-like chemotaxis protein
MVSVSDNGQGMPPGIVQRIFEPFFTTKDMGFGTGLGLSTVYGIVKQSRGHVVVHSEVGVGTQFKVYFPIVAGEATALNTEEPATGDLSGEATILLVEDDDAVREYTASVLRDYGYRVIEAPNGQQAMGESENYSGAIDLLLTDLVMPGLNGRDLVALIRRGRPRIKVLFMSGYTENTVIHDGALEQGLHFLAKPFLPEELGGIVRFVLATPQLETRSCVGRPSYFGQASQR